MLRTYAAPPWVAVAFPLSLVSFKRVNFQGTRRGFYSLGVVLPGGMNMASCLISMVFEDFQPESPGVNVLAKERPCLEHVQQSGMRVGQPLAYVLSLIFHWRQFNLEESVHPRNGNHAYLICCPKVPYAAYMLSMVFKICRPKLPGTNTLSGWKPCLEHVQRYPGLL